MRVDSYFCRPYLEDWFFKNPHHAKYINKEAVEKYYPVGGVRIEDWFVVPLPSPPFLFCRTVEMISRFPPREQRKRESTNTRTSIVITAKGFDNLTSAPKGEEMLKVINAGY